jgi:F-type H+-transporting ATPase subunit b
MNDILHALGIQWSALIAQAINFVILLFLLSRFVYKPVLGVIDRRRTEVAESMEKAKEIDRQKEIIDEQRTVILRKADEEAGQLLSRAKAEADALHADIEKAAKAQAAQIVTKGMEQLENERAHMVREIQDKLAHAIVKSAENILRREFSKEDQASFEDELKKNLPAMLS